VILSSVDLVDQHGQGEPKPSRLTWSNGDTSGFRLPVGQPAQVGVDVTCRISMADLYLPGLHGEKLLHEHWVSTLEPFRARA